MNDYLLEIFTREGVGTEVIWQQAKKRPARRQLGPR